MTWDGQPADVGDALSLIVPMYNECERFAENRDALLGFVRSYGPASELIFVDDGSTDGTGDLVAKWIAEAGHLACRLVSIPHLGKGAAVRAGLAEAPTAYAAFCDVDLSTHLDDLARVIDTARERHGLAVGSRAVDGATLVRRQHPSREALGRLYNHLLRATVIDGVHDTQCGAKAAPTSVWNSIIELSRERGFAWDVEAIAIAQRLGIDVCEVPVAWANDHRTRVRAVRDGMRLVTAVPRIARHLGAVGRG